MEKRVGFLWRFGDNDGYLLNPIISQIHHALRTSQVAVVAQNTVNKLLTGEDQAREGEGGRGRRFNVKCNDGGRARCVFTL